MSLKGLDDSTCPPFGCELKCSELGNFAIGKVGVEANYKVNLKWTKKEDDDLHKKIDAIHAKRLRRKVNSGYIRIAIYLIGYHLNRS